MSTGEALTAPLSIREPAQAVGRRPCVFLMIDQLQTGGSERQFAALAQSLSREAFQLRLGCMRRIGSFLNGLDEVFEFSPGGSFLRPRAARACFSLARFLQSQLVAVAHSFDFYSNLMLVPAAKWAGVPAVIGSQRQLGNLLSPMQFGVQAAILHLCDRVACNSRAAANGLMNEGLEERKIVIIPNGLPESAFAKAEPFSPRVPGVVRVGMIARMNNPVKNHPIFLRAAARLATRYPHLEFLLVGDGPLRPRLEAMAERLGLGDRIKFLGERHDIPAILAATDISVLPSSSESLSNAILESMAAGKPVVAARVGGNPELVQDGQTGLLVPPDNEEQLAEALEFLIRQPAFRVEWGQRAKKHARENFTMDRVRGQYEELYTALLKEKGDRSRRPSTAPRRSALLGGRLRVAVIAPSLRWIGGQAVQAHLLVKHWQEDRAVDVRFIPIDPCLPRWLAWAECVPYLRTVLRMPFYLAALWRGTKHVEIAHIFSGSYWSFILAPVPAWLAGRLRGAKVLINYHSGEARDHLRRWRIARSVLARADRLVVPSNYLTGVFREFDLTAHVVPNVVDLNQFCYRRRQSVRPLLICTRGFEPYYSLDVIVRAFAEIKRKLPEAYLWLVGKGSLEPRIRALAANLNLPDVEFTGPIRHRDISHFYDRADIFINASWLDNMPISILEAFASGTPVVSTAPEGIRYMVEHERTGLLCAPGDWQALADNIMRLVREPELATSLARNAFEESRRYRWESVRTQWLRLYRSLQQPGMPGPTPEPTAGDVEQ